MPEEKIKLKTKIWQFEILSIIAIISLSTFFIFLKLSYFIFIFLIEKSLNVNLVKYLMLTISLLTFILTNRKKFVLFRKYLDLIYVSRDSILPDEITKALPSAIDFIYGRKTGNYDLAQAHIKFTYEKTKNLPVFIFWKKYFNYKNLALLFGVFLLYKIQISNTISFEMFINPFKLIYFEDFFQIKAEKEILENEDFKLKIYPLKTISYIPELFIEDEKKEIQAKGNNFEFIEKSVKKSLKYYFKAKGIKSHNYFLNLIKNPEIKSTKLIISYPPYLERKKEKIDFLPETIEVIEGSLITFYFLTESNIAEIGAELKNLFSQNKKNEYLKKEKNTFVYSYMPKGKEEITFYFDFKDGKKINFASSIIQTLKDNPPECEIINYTSEVKLTPETLYQMNYYAQDDIGIKKISILKETLEGINEFLIENFSVYPTRKTGYYLISPLELKNKQKLNLQLKVEDLKKQICLSKKITISFNDKLETHYKNIQDIYKYTEKINELENILKNETLNLPQIRKNFENLEFKGQEIIKEIQDDLYFENWNKINIRNSINKIQEISKKKFNDFMENKISKEEILSELSSARENLLNSLKLENISTISQSLNPIDTSFEKINDILNKENITKQEIEQLKQEIANILNEINDLAKAFKNLNETKDIKEKIFNIPLQEIEKNAISLNEALEKGNLKDAKEYLKKMADSLKRSLSAMKEFKEYVYLQSKFNLMKKELEAINNRWEKIYEDEKLEFEENSRFSEDFYSKFEEKRKNTAEKLIKELFELENTTLTATQKQLIKQNISELKALTTSLTLIPSNENIQIANINQSLKVFSKYESFWEEKEKDFFKIHATAQEKILEEAKLLEKDIEKNFFDEKAISKLNLAITEMENAKNYLLDFDIINTISSQLKALNYLKQGQQELQNNINEFLNSFQESSKSIYSPYGTSGNYVKIPGKDEYIPPELLRKEVIKTLTEDIPSETKEILNQYYRNITK